jgi:hypothetical protein
VKSVGMLRILKQKRVNTSFMNVKSASIKILALSERVMEKTRADLIKWFLAIFFDRS